MSALAVGVSERAQRRITTPLPKPPIPDGASAVLTVLRSSALVIDRSERVVNTSPSAVALGLIDREHLVQPALLDAVRKVHRDGEIRELELEIPLPGRPSAWVLARVAPLLDAHVLLLIDDLTTAHRVEEVRRDFVVNVSHELKTPVGGLSLLAEAIADAKDDPEAVERFASRMQLESARLGKLIKEIVDLSRLQSADGMQQPRPVLIAEVVREAVDLSLIEAEAKGIRIVERVAPGAVAYGDYSLLVTAVRNLIDNAIAYSPAGTEVGVGGHTGRRAGADLRTLLSRRRGALAQHRWHRAGVGYRQTHLRQPRRSGQCVEPPRARLHLHHQPATGPRAGGRRRPHPGRKLRMSAVRILVIEDEPSYSEPLTYLLRKEGYQVSVAETGPDGLAAFERMGADLVLLDVMLPEMSGIDVCRHLRVKSKVPVIMLTAKDSEIDKVVGLELGADDYVTKPYSSRELLARIKAVLRRGTEPDELHPSSVVAGPVAIDVDRHIVAIRGERITLPLKEFELLEFLVRNSGRVLTRGQLIDRIWGSDYVGDTKTLDVHIKRLRKKVEHTPKEPEHILTVRGLGYKFEV